MIVCEDINDGGNTHSFSAPVMSGYETSPPKNFKAYQGDASLVIPDEIGMTKHGMTTVTGS